MHKGKLPCRPLPDLLWPAIHRFLSTIPSFWQLTYWTQHVSFLLISSVRMNRWMEPSYVYSWSFLSDSGLNKQQHSSGASLSPCDAGKPHTARLGIYTGSSVWLPRAEWQSKPRETLPNLYFIFSWPSEEDFTSRVIGKNIEDNSARGCSRRLSDSRMGLKGRAPPRCFMICSALEHLRLFLPWLTTSCTSCLRTEGIRLGKLRVGRMT